MLDRPPTPISSEKRNEDNRSPSDSAAHPRMLSSQSEDPCHCLLSVTLACLQLRPGLVQLQMLLISHLCPPSRQTAHIKGKKLVTMKFRTLLRKHLPAAHPQSRTPWRDGQVLMKRVDQNDQNEHCYRRSVSYVWKTHRRCWWRCSCYWFPHSEKTPSAPSRHASRACWGQHPASIDCSE